MKTRTLKLALAVATTTMFVVPAMAQDNFPDVPENHWAFEAIENLKREGILVGYPDGTYKGPRATTRYELAVALNAAYQRLKNITDGLAEQIAELRAMAGQGNNGGMVDRLNALETQVKGMSSMADDMGAMKRMANEFQKELAGLGVDVEQMKKDIDEMKKMMSGTGSAAITISGDANIVVHAGAGEDGGFSMGIDGRLLGLDETRFDRTSILGDLNVYHEIALNIASNGKGPKWDATLVYGNLLEPALASSCSFGGGVVQGYGNQSGRFGGTFFGEGSGDMYVQRFAVDLSNSMPFNAVVGRIGSQTANPYVFKRKDNSPYFDNSRWDDGNWTVDGALVNFKVGQGSLSIVGGRNNDRLTNNGVELQPIMNDSVTFVQDTLGAEAKFNLGANANLSAAYFMHFLTGNGSSATGGADRLEVFGAGLNYNLGGGLTAGVNYASSALKNQGSTIADDNNTALAVELGYGTDKWGLVGGYHRIDRDFKSAGSWYRIGTNYSPVNVEDWMVKGWFKLGTNGKITASYMDGENVRSTESAAVNAAVNNFEYTSFKADLDYTVWGNWNLLLGYESVDLDGSRTPFLSTTTNYSIEQKWTSLGLSYNMSSNSMFKVLYQYGDVKNGRAWGAGPSGNYKGHILTSQISIKF